MKCLCGCGKKVTGKGYWWVYGHRKTFEVNHGRLKARRLHYHATKRTKNGIFCQCGCGKKLPTLTRISMDGQETIYQPAFIPGHQWKKTNYDLKKRYSRRSSLRIATDQYYGKACLVCGWDLASLDVHHIIKRDSIGSVVMICPNCHRMAHENKISKKELLYVQKRYIDNRGVQRTPGGAFRQQL